MLSSSRMGLWVVSACFAGACLLVGCARNPTNKPRIVYVDMVADLFHPGHVAFLEKAAASGDYLIVGLISDEDAESYNKRRPIMSLAERSELIKSCRYVNEVIPGCPYRLSDELLDHLRIDLVIHGDDYSQESLYYYYQPAIDRGLFKTIGYTPDISTSDLIERVKERPVSLLHLQAHSNGME